MDNISGHDALEDNFQIRNNLVKYRMKRATGFKSAGLRMY